MNTFKRKALFSAVLAGLGAAGTAEAVYLNPNGTGQALVYPYYTVQRVGGNEWNTYLSIVNTTSRAKAVKVRVLEGKGSVEVLDFNLFLSPNDMWTAAIIPNADGGGTMVTQDTSCTAPVGRLRGTGEPFRNTLFTGTDGIMGTGVDRTREGYVEILEMGTLTGTWAAAVTHNATGSPANCALVQGDAAPSSIEAPSGGLAGTGTLVNVANGQEAGYKADALEAWRSTPFYTNGGAETPKLNEASPAQSLVINAGGRDASGASVLITAYRSNFVTTSNVAAGARAVASVYMHSSIMNEFILDNATVSQTDWVITQPMKRFFVNTTTAAQPYTNVLTAGGSCETIGFTFFDREERTDTARPGDFSPSTTTDLTSSLCWESTVLSVRNDEPHTVALSAAQSGVLGSMNHRNVRVVQQNAAAPVLRGFQNGWARLSFLGNGAANLGLGSLVSDRFQLDSTSAIGTTGFTGVGVTFFGLPVTGFMVRTFRNNTGQPQASCGTGATTACASTYGSLFNHSYETTIRP